MGVKKIRENKIIIGLSLFILILVSIFVINIVNQKEVVGKVYFNKPVSWEQAYAYVYDENGKDILGKWPGIELTQQEDYICFFELTTKENKNIEYKVIFNNGSEYEVEDEYEGYNKIYNITRGIGENNTDTEGEWLEYSQDIKIGKIPTTDKQIKNVIYMIGDGMGENHIIAGGIYKEQTLNIQKIQNKSYLKTASSSTVTDSAAGATALSTGHKTINGAIGKDKYGNDVQNLIEYANIKNMKTGLICTQILNHATPAGFSVHNSYRYNYDEIVQSQIESGIDLMLGGGTKYFKPYHSKIIDNSYKWINKLSELNNVEKEEKVIGTFAEESISEETERTSLADMTNKALSKLENQNGFIVMIEGSCIDTYSHESNINKMLTEMIDFDDAVRIAMEYVDNHPDTLLIVTADHETGGLNLNGVSSKEQLTDNLFTLINQHTETNVPIYAYGIGAEDVTKYNVIDNTSVYKFIKQGIDNYKNK